MSTRRERWRADGGPRLARLSLAAALVTAVFLVAGGVLVVRAVGAYHRSDDQLTGRLDPAISDVDTLLTAFVDEETATRGYLLSGDATFLQPFDAAQPVIAADTAELDRLTAGDPVARRDIGAVLAAHGTWRTTAADPEQGDVRAGDLAAGRTLEASGVGKTAFDGLRIATADLGTHLEQQRLAVESRNRADQTRVLVVGGTVVALLLLLLLTGGMLLWRGILRPLQLLGTAADRVSLIDPDVALPAAVPPEIRNVGRAVERMRSQLARQLRTAREAQEALAQRGEAVLALRAELTPHLAPVPGLAVAARLVPAEGLLAGDWYDQVLLPDGRVALVVGDVSGHGAAAGAYALGLSRSLRSALTAGMTPSQSLAHVGALLDESNDERFASVFVAIVDLGAGTGTYASAGHPEALVFAPDGSIRQLSATGPLLAPLFVGPQAWRTAAFAMPDDALLLAVTDGLLEARDAERDEFGSTRLVSTVLGLVGGAGGNGSPETLLDDLFDRVERFTAGLAADDRTALAVVRHSSTLSTDAVRPPSRLR